MYSQLIEKGVECVDPSLFGSCTHGEHPFFGEDEDEDEQEN